MDTFDEKLAVKKVGQLKGFSQAELNHRKKMTSFATYEQ